MIDSKRQARIFEQENKWADAAKMWKLCNQRQDADACEMIADAIAKGDAHRREVAETIGEEPELTHANTHAWQKWHDDLRIIYKKHYQ